jgi:exosortase
MSNDSQAMSTTDVAERERARSWLALGACLMLVGVLLVLLYGDTARRMAQQWSAEEEYHHGFLVPLFSAYLIWEDRRRFKGLPLAPSVPGAALLGLGLALFVVGRLGAELFLQRASVVVVLAGLALLVLGRGFLKVLAFPIAFLFFMVPIPAVIRNVIAFPLQLFAAQTATFCLSGAGIPVLREGNVIVLAQTTLEVADACSGIRSLQALLALGAVYGYLSQRAAWKRWILFLAAIPIAILVNALRVSGTGLLAHFFGPGVADGFYHSLAGYLMFGVAFAGLLACGGVLNWLAPERPSPEQGAPP